MRKMLHDSDWEPWKRDELDHLISLRKFFVVVIVVYLFFGSAIIMNIPDTFCCF